MRKRINKLVIIPILLIGIILSTIFIINNNSRQEFKNEAKEQLDPREVQRANGLEISPDHPALYITQTVEVPVTAVPSGLTRSQISWSCLQPMMAECTAINNGEKVRIKGNGIGNTVLIGKNPDGQEISRFQVTIEHPNFTINNSNPVMYIGQTYTVEVTAIPSTAEVISWSIGQPLVAEIKSSTVGNHGTATIEGKTNNTTILKAKLSGGFEVEIPVVVKKPTISINGGNFTLNTGGTKTLSASIEPSNATVTWRSADTSIATVSSTGKVTAVKKGSTTIYASIPGANEASVTVTVKDVDTSSVTIAPTSLSLEVGKTSTLTATVKPDDATNKTVEWSSSDSNVATVNSSGLVTAKKNGKATITATVKNTTIKNSIEVTVYTKMTSITLSKSAETLAVGDTDTLEYGFLPSDATATGVNWSSSDETVATVDANGKVTAKKAGKATITAKAKTGTAQASCVYTVIEKQVVKITKLTIEAKTKKVKVGKTIQLTVKVEPENATEGVIWKSSDEKILTVSQDGVVTGVKAGKAKVTVTNQDGTIKSEVTITVVNNSSGSGNPGTGAAISIFAILLLLVISKFLIDYSKKFQRTHKMIHKI